MFEKNSESSKANYLSQKHVHPRFQWIRHRSSNLVGQESIVEDLWLKEKVLFSSVQPHLLKNDDLVKDFYVRVLQATRWKHKNLQHPLEISFFPLSTEHEKDSEKTQFYIHLPWLENQKTLYEWQQEQPALFQKSNWVSSVLLQVGEAISSLHSTNCHGLSCSPLNLDLCFLGDNQTKIFCCLKNTWYSNELTHKIFFSSPYQLLFLAPEWLEDEKKSSEAADLFSFGVLCFYALTGEFPFLSFDELSRFQDSSNIQALSAFLLSRYQLLQKDGIPSTIEDVQSLVWENSQNNVSNELIEILLGFLCLHEEGRPSSLKHFLQLLQRDLQLPTFSESALPSVSPQVAEMELAIQDLLLFGDFELAKEQLRLAQERFPSHREFFFLSNVFGGLATLRERTHQKEKDAAQKLEEASQQKKEIEEAQKKVKVALIQAKNTTSKMEQKLTETTEQLRKAQAQNAQGMPSIPHENAEMREQFEKQIALFKKELAYATEDKELFFQQADKRKKELILALLLLLIFVPFSLYSFFQPFSSNPQPKKKKELLSTTSQKVEKKLSLEVDKPLKLEKISLRDAGTSAPSTPKIPDSSLQEKEPSSAKTSEPSKEKEVPTDSTPPTTSNRIALEGGEIHKEKDCRPNYVFACFYSCIKRDKEGVCLQRKSKQQCGCLKKRFSYFAPVSFSLLRKTGPLLETHLKKTLDKESNRLKACTQFSLQQTNPIDVRFTLIRSRKPVKIRIQGANNAELRKCIVGSLRRFRHYYRQRSPNTRVHAQIQFSATPKPSPPWDRVCRNQWLVFKCFTPCSRRGSGGKCAVPAKRQWCGCVSPNR